MVNAADLGWSADPAAQVEEDVRPYRHLTPRERYERFVDLMAFMERIWKSIDPARRAQYERVQDQLDDPGRWWERVPRDGDGV